MAFGLINRLPDSAGVPFIKWRRVAYALSITLIIISIIAVVARGLNFGIDFRGGVLIQAGNPQAADISQFIDNFDLLDVDVEVTGDESEVVVDFTGSGALARAGVIAREMLGEEGGEGGRFSCLSSTGVEETASGARLALVLPPPLPPMDDIRGAVQSAVPGLDVQVQEFGGPNTLLLRVEAESGESAEAIRAQQETAGRVRGALLEAAPMCILRNEGVSAKVSGELLRGGVLALVLALGLMLIYIWFRFEWHFSLGAVAALVHDVILTIGMFAVTQLEFNLSTVAALLTIIGYSMNDTVVVYDRVREYMRKFKRTPMPQVLNDSINSTLSRTTMTSLTTLLALVSLFVFGGEVLRSFSFAMIWGVVIGTYSSIFVAAPLLLITGLRGGVDGPGAPDEGGAPAQA